MRLHQGMYASGRMRWLHSVIRMGTGKSEFVETKETEPVDKVGWIIRRILELGGYENVSDSVKADVFGFDITDVSGSIKLFSDVMKRLGIKLDGDELYEEFQRIYDESVNRDACKEKAEDRSCKIGAVRKNRTQFILFDRHSHDLAKMNVS